MDKEKRNGVGDIYSNKIPWQEYMRLYVVEATLRWLIGNFLRNQKISRVNLSRILEESDKNRRNQVEKEKDSKVPKTLYSDPLLYLDFPQHYIKIIEQNWKVFKTIFLYKTRIIDDLKSLEPLRHNIAHMRPLRKEQKDFLNVITRRILRHVWDYINDRYVKPALKYEKERLYEKAIETLRKGLKETKNELLYDEGDPWIAYNLGKILKKSGKIEEAKKWLNYAKINLPLESPYRELVENELKSL